MFLNRFLKNIGYYFLFLMSIINVSCTVIEPVSQSSVTRYYINDNEINNIEMSAENGEVEAQKRLFNYYTFVNFDIQKQFYWARKASENGDVDSQYNFAILIFSIADVGKYKEANKLLEQASAKNPLAIYQIGLSYSEGRGYVQDKSKACQYFKKAAEIGVEMASIEYSKLNCE